MNFIINFNPTRSLVGLLSVCFPAPVSVLIPPPYPVWYYSSSLSKVWPPCSTFSFMVICLPWVLSYINICSGLALLPPTLPLYYSTTGCMPWSSEVPPPARRLPSLGIPISPSTFLIGCNHYIHLVNPTFTPSRTNTMVTIIIHI